MPRGEQATSFTLDVIRQVVRQMGNLPGQRTLILISSGFIASTPTAMDAKSRVIDIAAQADVTINALDARGIYTEMEDENKRLESRDLNLFMSQDRIAHGDYHGAACRRNGRGPTFTTATISAVSVPACELFRGQFFPSP